MKNNIIFKLKDGGITEISPIDKVFYPYENKEESLNKSYTCITTINKEIIIPKSIKIVEKELLKNALAINNMKEKEFLKWVKSW